MNVENINKLADTLEEVHEKNQELFDMGNWGDEMWKEVLRNMRTALKPVEVEGIALDDKIEHCGTSGCIAGWAVLLLGDGPPGNREMSNYAADLLGLDDDRVAGNLFTPGSDQLGGMSYGDITAGMAAEVLRDLAMTGEANWSLVSWASDDDDDEEEEDDDNPEDEEDEE